MISKRTLTACAVGFALGLLGFRPIRTHVAAVRVLSHLGGPAGPAARTASFAKTTTEIVVSRPAGPVPARLYRPDGPVRGCVVVGHGVHYLGIDEPRLVRFSTELSHVGLLVLTPELRDLADYRITPDGALVLGAAVHDLAARCSGPVGLMGFSFAGGLSLLAAEDPRVGADLTYVASVGGYDDLGRVRRFLLTDEVETLHGLEPRRAHEYGQIVLLYEHLSEFVPEADLPLMQSAVKEWLHEKRDRAWALASRCTTPAAEELFVRVATGKTAVYRDALGAILTKLDADSRALSPTGKLDQIAVPVLLLHGEGDSVIPPEETLWADRELANRPHHALVTPLLEHVEISGKPRWQDQVELVNFMARLF